MVRKVSLAAAAVVVFVVALMAYMIDRKLDEMEIDSANVILEPRNPPTDVPSVSSVEPTMQVEPEEPEPEDFYVLLIGLDQRDNWFTLNTDSLIVAHIIPQTHTVKLMSIPRDQRVAVREADNNSKANAVFAEGYQTAVRAARDNPDLLSGRRVKFGSVQVHEEYISSGIALLKETMEQHLDVPISYAFIVHFQSVIALVDKVGGIDINVDRSMQYTAEFDGTSIQLEPGLQTLDGINALNYMRHRKDDRGPAYESSDFDRGRRQQEVIAALAGKIADWGSLPKAMGLLDIITTNIKTDMKRTRMVSLLSDFYGHLSTDSIISIPYPGEWIYPYVEVIEPDFQFALERFRAVDDQTDDQTESDNQASGSDQANQTEHIEKDHQE